CARGGPYYDYDGAWFAYW
nr:immunoglobulin heavy chain junction region [Mus musculus]NSM03925.1 immunoglobulin heavy chain junction region [Mus musculus]NSM04048.1 immunoglobulin heavy chain junction region [Mus musculus]NSM04726.1 immunoglobulin heavy chain junction region [Mus musculus]NSM04754.1 immunoglobulin heavy chain junction region [Mus musculus]